MIRKGKDYLMSTQVSTASDGITRPITNSTHPSRVQYIRNYIAKEEPASNWERMITGRCVRMPETGPLSISFTPLTRNHNIENIL